MHATHYLTLLRRHATLNNGVLFVAAIIVVASVWNTLSTLQRNFRLQQKVDLLSQQIEVAKLEAETLELQQQYYKSAEYIELTARAKLGKAMPGEKVIILPSSPKSVPGASPSTTTIKPEKSNFDKWLQFFFGR